MFKADVHEVKTHVCENVCNPTQCSCLWLHQTPTLSQRGSTLSVNVYFFCGRAM